MRARARWQGQAPMGSDARRIFRDPYYRSETAADVLLRSSPTGDTDTHGDASLPVGAAAPAGSVFLNLGDNPPIQGGISEGHEHLIQNHIVQHGVTGSRQTFSEATGQSAVAF